MSCSGKMNVILTDMQNNTRKDGSDAFDAKFIKPVAQIGLAEAGSFANIHRACCGSSDQRLFLRSSFSYYCLPATSEILTLSNRVTVSFEPRAEPGWYCTGRCEISKQPGHPKLRMTQAFPGGPQPSSARKIIVG
jgi:hypothetical protein